jgi:hypothetical protein
MDADAERHRAQAASYLEIAKLMTSQTSAGALRAKAQDHLLKAKAIEDRQVKAPEVVSASAVSCTEDERAAIFNQGPFNSEVQRGEFWR